MSSCATDSYKLCRLLSHMCWPRRRKPPWSLWGSSPTGSSSWFRGRTRLLPCEETSVGVLVTMSLGRTGRSMALTAVDEDEADGAPDVVDRVPFPTD